GDRSQHLPPDTPGLAGQRPLLLRQGERHRGRLITPAADPRALDGRLGWLRTRHKGGRMAESPYWNPRHETMPREELEGLQVRKLRNLVEWADASVPWQSKRLRDAGVTADS